MDFQKILIFRALPEHSKDHFEKKKLRRKHIFEKKKKQLQCRFWALLENIDKKTPKWGPLPGEGSNP